MAIKGNTPSGDRQLGCGVRHRILLLVVAQALNRRSHWPFRVWRMELLTSVLSSDVIAPF